MRSNPRFRRSLASKLRGVLSEAEACDFVTEPLQTSATYEPRKLHVRGRGGRNPLSHYTGTYERQKPAREQVSSFEEYGLLRSVRESPWMDSKRGNTIRETRLYELLSDAGSRRWSINRSLHFEPEMLDCLCPF